MSELYRNYNFCVAAGSFLNIEEDNENEIILSFTDGDKAVTRACFHRTGSLFSNYNKLQRIKQHMKEGDLFAVAGYGDKAFISAHRFAIWSGTFFHEKLVDRFGNPLTVVVGKIRGDRYGEPRNMVVDPAGACREVEDFSMFVNDHSVRQIWNIRISGPSLRKHHWEIKPHRGAVVLGHELEPKGYVHRLEGEDLVTITFPLKATA